MEKLRKTGNSRNQRDNTGARDGAGDGGGDSAGGGDAGGDGGGDGGGVGDGTGTLAPPARNGFFGIAWGTAYRIMAIIAALTVLGLLTGTARDDWNIAILLKDNARPPQGDVDTVRTVIDSLGLSFASNRAARFPTARDQRLIDEIELVQEALIPILTEDGQTTDARTIAARMNQVMETLNNNRGMVGVLGLQTLDYGDVRDVVIAARPRVPSRASRRSRLAAEAHGDVIADADILDYDLREVTEENTEENADEVVEPAGAGGGAAKTRKRTKKTTGRGDKVGKGCKIPSPPPANPLRSMRPRIRLTMQEQMQLFQLDSPVMRSGILFMNLNVIPMRIPLDNDGDLLDPDLSVELGVEINRWLNSEGFARKIKEVCRKNNVHAGTVRKTATSQYSLINEDFEVIEAKKLCNLYTGLATNSYETEEQKCKDSDGVRSASKPRFRST